MATTITTNNIQSPSEGTTVPTTPPPSAAVYKSYILPIYDFWVLYVSNTFAWKCSTRDVQLPFFRANLKAAAAAAASSGGGPHLDVGVGTGFYLVHTADLLQARPEGLVLMDLAPATMGLATQRLARAAPGFQSVQSVLHDVTTPWAGVRSQLDGNTNTNSNKKFSSISLFFLLHCLRGTSITEKADAVCKTLKVHLEPKNGVLFGTTILGDEVEHNWFGSILMNIYNKKGIFGNRGDKEGDLRETLQAHFHDVEVKRVGKVALFTARKPILKPENDE